VEEACAGPDHRNRGTSDRPEIENGQSSEGSIRRPRSASSWSSRQDPARVLDGLRLVRRRLPGRGRKASRWRSRCTLPRGQLPSWTAFR